VTTSASAVCGFIYTGVKNLVVVGNKFTNLAKNWLSNGCTDVMGEMNNTFRVLVWQLV
jgi:hypothetical protein